MTAKKWLGRARWIDREIETLERTKEETRDRLLKITQSYEFKEAQTSPDPHKYDKLVEIESLIDEKTEELLAVKLEIIQAILLLDDRRQKMVLMSYYVRMKTFEQIAVEMNYSFRQITNIRRRGILEIQRIMEKELS